MSRGRSVLGFTALTLTVGLFLGSTHGVEAQTASASGKIKATLTKVQETRRAKLAAFKDDANMFEFNKPGLELTFGITCPSGKQIQRLDQPSVISATDSTGQDIADIEPNFMGRKRYVTLIQTYGKPPEDFTLTLSPPARSAEHFSVNAQFDVWTFDRITESKFQVKAGQGNPDGRMFGSKKMTANVIKSGDSLHLVFTPGTVKENIESVVLVSGGSEYQSNGSMWSAASLTYIFQAPFASDLQVKANVRVGMEKHPCRVTINRQSLP